MRERKWKGRRKWNTRGNLLTVRLVIGVSHLKCLNTRSEPRTLLGLAAVVTSKYFAG